ncbi:MAG: flagellar basal body L-ring protein FlgH [Firmicutes bacterium]|nr:flagellar basal body L-ring protein FlgH [Bacillota bacterium]HQD39827.1 flagellar basal body L-ring protein FlgH [Bacillota bacterium]
MRIWIFLLCFLCVCGTLEAVVLQPTSSLYQDQKAKNVGDLVTIIIVESSKASQQASTNTGKESDVGVSPGGGLLRFIPIFGIGGQTRSDSQGSTTRGGSITARVTAKVVEVLPNGNLVLEGSQQIVVNKEQQEIILRGVVRPQDITPENTILSSYLADAKIEYKGEGPIGGRRQEPGLLTNFFGLFDWLF